MTSACTNDDFEDLGADIAPISIDVSKVDAIATTLPSSVRDAGRIVVGVNVPYAPNEFKVNGRIIGFDVDLMNTITKVLGVRAEYREADFAKIIPSVTAGTFDLGMSSFTVTDERLKSVDFVTYFSAGIQWAQRAGNDIDPTRACGKRVGVQRGTTEADEEVPAKSKACTDAGNPAIDVVKFNSQDEATTAVILGKVDAMSADSPVTDYAIKRAGGRIVKAGEPFESAPYGYPMVRGSELAEPVRAALQYLIDNGQYRAIAAHWGVQTGMISTAEIRRGA
ncbi:ABC transporter substrate-binding protein [Gordonia sp. ABSL1-1]|uniref:ABC transporter substrate-binding protein n=1 Tax=Gordonia sp. ABSL1-1 TaxID=3053923 RepID=UPI002572CCED|nr:ABC transporter substrate-binding protein [Gordonia sp. ABSL1-1]MDL9938177.1 ABC transporter substrate-binding protein [Gordonia sp. ABSL1-1]